MGRVPNSLRGELPGLFVTLAVGVLLGGLLVGFEPVGGDPDRMYRPLKAELARALAEGRLPFWSDRMGLGVPLVSESHVAAFYPPNLVAYRLLRRVDGLPPLDVAARSRAGRNDLRLRPSYRPDALGKRPGCALVFALRFPGDPCDARAILLPDAVSPAGPPAGRRLHRLGPLGLARGLALTLGTQWTLGHFQIQSWTNGLVLLTGLWRVAADRRPWRAWGWADRGRGLGRRGRRRSARAELGHGPHGRPHGPDASRHVVFLVPTRTLDRAGVALVLSRLAFRGRRPLVRGANGRRATRRAFTSVRSR